MKYLKLFESFKDIDSICKKFGIYNYTINEDGTIDVIASRFFRGDVDLSNKGLTELPLKFRNVTGYFYCYDNKLTSLEGSPQSVGGRFDCGDNNQLTSLEGGPREVGGNFYCGNNHLTSLEGCPQSVGGSFFCKNNKLTSLDGCPKVGGYFYCLQNPPLPKEIMDNPKAEILRLQRESKLNTLLNSF
jgi:hypothetical protein